MTDQNGKWESEAERRNNIRERILSNTRNELQEQRNFVRTLIQRERGSRNNATPSNVVPWLAGLSLGLDLGKTAVEGMDREVMYEPESDDGGESA